MLIWHLNLKHFLHVSNILWYISSTSANSSLDFYIRDGLWLKYNVDTNPQQLGCKGNPKQQRLADHYNYTVYVTVSLQFRGNFPTETLLFLTKVCKSSQRFCHIIKIASLINNLPKFANKYQLANLKNAANNCSPILVTGFTKTIPIGTRNEIQFIADY